MWLTLAAMLISAEPTSAEALFKKMEEQVLQAKSLQTYLNLDVVSGKDSITMKGRILTAEGDKARFDLESEESGKKEQISTYSDGMKQVDITDGKLGKAHDTKKGLNRFILGAVTRSSMFVGLTLISPAFSENKENNIEKLFAISDFKLGKKELIAGSETQSVEYKLTNSVTKESLDMTVWIDLKTNLPVKRTFTIKEGKAEIRVTEMYTKTLLNEKIDDKEFALPK